MSSQLEIDWDNLPKCGGQGLVISPYICGDYDYQSPHEPPVHAVPVPATLPLILLGIGVMKCLRR